MGRQRLVTFGRTFTGKLQQLNPEQSSFTFKIMNPSRKFSAKKGIALVLITVVFAITDFAIGQTFSFVVVRNGEFTNLIDQNGNLVFSIVKNGQFSSLVDNEGNFAYSLVQNGQIAALVDQNGNAAFSVAYNGQFMVLTPVPAETPRRSEINKENRQRAEIMANATGMQQQRQQAELATAAQKLREDLRKNREKFKAIGFTDEELDRFGRVLTKFEESNEYLSEHPEPTRFLTGIGESNVDFSRRHGGWSYDARPHLNTLNLCNEEITKFMEKYNRLRDH